MDAILNDKFVGGLVGGPVIQRNFEINTKTLFTAIHTFLGIFVGRNWFQEVSTKYFIKSSGTFCPRLSWTSWKHVERTLTRKESDDVVMIKWSGARKFLILEVTIVCRGELYLLWSHQTGSLTVDHTIACNVSDSSSMLKVLYTMLLMWKAIQ